MKNILLTTALAGSVVFAAHAQNSGTAATAAQGGANQRWTQEANLGGSGAQLMISPADVRLIVQALNQRGYSAGNVNGTWSPAASQAAANFEATVGLEPTGTITTALIQALGLNNIMTASVNPGGRGGNQGGGNQGGGNQGGMGRGGLEPSLGHLQNLPWLAGVPQGLSLRWTNEQAVDQGTPLFISPADVRLIQQGLNQKGYSAGNVQGNWDQASQKAAADFQRANNLEPNGEIDLSLIAALGLQGILNGQGVGGAPRQAMQIAQASAQSGLPPTGQRRTQESASGKGVPLYLGPAGVRYVHLILNRIGFSAGHIQSAFNQNGQTALADFQRSLGLEPTGTLTTETIAALGLAPWLQGGGANTASTANIGRVSGGPSGGNMGGGTMNANAGGAGGNNAGGGVGVGANAGAGGAGAGGHAGNFGGGVGVGPGGQHMGGPGGGNGQPNR